MEDDKPAEVLEGYDEPNDETMSEEVREKLAQPPKDVPPASDELDS